MGQAERKVNLRPLHLMRIMPPEEVAEEYVLFQGASHWGAPCFCLFTEKDVVLETAVCLRRVEGERPEPCMTAMGSRVPA